MKSPAILVIDMQVDFLSPQGNAARQGVDVGPMASVIEPINELLVEARKYHTPIIFTQYIDALKYRDAAGLHMFAKKEKQETNMMCLEGTSGCDFYGVIPEKQDHIIVKHSYSCFAGTNLEPLLKEMDVKTLIITGVKTNACVETTVRDAYHRGYLVKVPRECVATNHVDLHEASLKNIDRYFGDVVSLQTAISTFAQNNI